MRRIGLFFQRLYSQTFSVIHIDCSVIIHVYYTAQLERRKSVILIGRERVTCRSIFGDIYRNNGPLYNQRHLLRHLFALAVAG